ncbi:hypothetical protein TNIN_23491 [Trichonephila inaurata madagascariensis]|uniref:Uncharacterized protein n=1 Tax=Trichonephila inaurata madagascariensis TaxID=2747483 RepID=A0A8X6XMN2_9ARAC|nr:hypothetical protein TNIN_23491 [Trichonephila inaurata madagascariensis]
MEDMLLVSPWIQGHPPLPTCNLAEKEDNCVTSVDDHEELEKFVEESKTILSTAKFELRGWEHSYEPESYDLLPPEGKSISVLGLRWRKTDSLTIDLRDCVEDDHL